MALCTIEKSNQLINALLSNGLLYKVVGIIVIDEIHLVRDGQKGSLLNTMLSKIVFQNYYHSQLHQQNRSSVQQVQPIQSTVPSQSRITTSTRSSLLLNGLLDKTSTSDGNDLNVNDVDIDFDVDMNCMSPVKEQPPFIQIIAMSATLPNLSSIARWLDAAEYETLYRPVLLKEMIFCNNRLLIYKPDGQKQDSQYSNPQENEKMERINDNWIVVKPPWAEIIENGNNNRKELHNKGLETSSKVKGDDYYQRYQYVPVVINSLMNHMNTLLFCSTKRGTEETAKIIVNSCEDRELIDPEIGQ